MGIGRELSRDAYVLWAYLLRRGARRPFLASYKLTERCNLRCAQCPFPREDGVDPPFALVRRTLERLYEMGVRILVFEGGEPFLWRDGTLTLRDVAAYARQRFFCVAATTNATLPLDAPTDVLWVSLDGLRATHNHLRGADIYDRVLDHIRTSPHPRIYAHITANCVNASEIPALLDALRDIVKGVTIQFYYPYQNRDRLYLDPAARSALIDVIIARKRAGYPLLNSIPALRALQAGGWRCADWLVASANPDGSITQGCYLNGRGGRDCTRCGFTPYTEISLAYRGNLAAIQAGLRIFFP